MVFWILLVIFIYFVWGYKVDGVVIVDVEKFVVINREVSIVVERMIGEYDRRLLFWLG